MGTCAECGRKRALASRGLCWSCYVALLDGRDPDRVARRITRRRVWDAAYRRRTEWQRKLPQRRERIRMLLRAFSCDADDLLAYILSMRASRKRQQTEGRLWTRASTPSSRPKRKAEGSRAKIFAKCAASLSTDTPSTPPRSPGASRKSFCRPTPTKRNSPEDSEALSCMRERLNCLAASLR